MQISRGLLRHLSDNSGVSQGIVLGDAHQSRKMMIVNNTQTSIKGKKIDQQFFVPYEVRVGYRYIHDL